MWLPAEATVSFGAGSAIAGILVSDTLHSTSSAQGDSGGGRQNVRLLLASPRGFCAGVRRAIDAVRDALAVHGPPVYVRRPIVHNLEVVRTLEAEGAIFIEELDEAPRGSAVVLSAHGVPPAVMADAERRGLRAYDAVCPLVAKVHREVERHQREGRHVILVGHEGHPEIEGTLGHVEAGNASLIGTVEDAASVAIPPGKSAAVAIQTTYSVDDAVAIAGMLRARFADLAEPPSTDICYATTNRQAAVKAIAARSDAVIVVGESFSSNANRLVEVAADRCACVQLVASVADVDWGSLPASGVIGVTAAASTPDSSVMGVIEEMQARFSVEVEEVHAAEETIAFKKVAIG